MAKQTKKSQQKITIPMKIILVTVSLIFIGLIAKVVHYYTWSEYPADLVAVANKFKPQEGWKLKSSIVRDRKNGCIDVQCPEVSRTYELDENLSESAFFDFIKQSVEKFDKTLVRCKLDRFNKVNICSYQQDYEGSYYYIFLANEREKSKGTISINITDGGIGK